DGKGLPVLFDGDVEARELALRRLHHQVELARLADVFIRLAELNGRPGLPSRPEPRHTAANDDQKENKRKELRKATHLLMMNDGGGAYKIRVACVLTFSGSRLRRRLGRGRRSRAGIV